MSRDIDTRAVIKNAWRITARRNLSCLRVRVPAGHLAARHLELIRTIAEQYGNGTVHLTSRQGFEIPGIPYDRIPEVNRLMAPFIGEVEGGLGIPIDTPGTGYPAAGMRNISACIGNRVCPYANADTTSMAQKLEAILYPNHYHVKVAVTGCPNDCAKAHLQDFGIIAICEPELESGRCIGCEACAKTCRKKVTGAISMHNFRPRRDPVLCIGCGECVLACPVNAWSRVPKHLYRLLIMGRTGKRNPRLAAPFIDAIEEAPLLQILRNCFSYIDPNIDKSLPKEHVGYIVDRTGYPAFREAVLKGVTLNPQAVVAESLTFAGYRPAPLRRP